MKITGKMQLLALVMLLLLNACTDTKEQEKAALNEVIKVHDEAMAKSETAIQNKMVLDSLVKTIKTADTAQIKETVDNLSTADKAMEDWMHQFNADYAGKSHEEIMQYLADQKKKVMAVNNRLNTAVSQSNQFLPTSKK